MSITMLEGFDDGGWEGRTSGTRDSTDVHTDYGVDGKGCRIGDTITSTVGLPMPASSDGFTVGMAAYFPSGSGTGNIVALNMTNPNYLLIQYDATSQRIGLSGRNMIGGGVSGEWAWTPGGSVPANVWIYLEIHLKYNTVGAGHFTVWVNGVEVFTTSTLDFSSSYPMNQFVLGYTHDLFYVDNIYVTDTNGTKNTLNLGPVEVIALYPSGNGNSSDLVGSDGNSVDNHLLVDENPADSADYVGSATEGDKDTYAMDDLADTPGIKGIIASFYAATTDSGAKYIRPVIRLSSTDYVGASIGLSTDYDYVEETFDDNPATSAAWTYSDINGMEFGQEVRDS